MTKPLNENQVAIRIVPTVLRWPDGKTIAWDRLRECVDALRAFVHAVDAHCVEAEGNRDLSPEGVVRRRTKLGQQALTELASFKPFQDAAKAVEANLAFLEERMTELPKPTNNVIEFMLEQEVRGHISEQNSPLDFTLKSLSDRRILSAVLNAPPYLSGLRDTEWNMVRERARTVLHPEQAEMQQWLKKALAEVQDGIAAAKRALMERCELREDKEGKVHSMREPPPTKDRAAVPKEGAASHS